MTFNDAKEIFGYKMNKKKNEQILFYKFEVTQELRKNIMQQ